MGNALTQYLVFCRPSEKELLVFLSLCPWKPAPAWYSLADEWANACPAPGRGWLPSPSFQVLARWEMLSAQPECGFCTWEICPDTWAQQGDHAGQPQRPQRIPGGELHVPTCTPGLGFSVLRSWPRLTHLAVLAAALLPWFPQKSELSLWAGTGAFGEGLRPAEYLGIRVLADQDGGGQAQFLLPHTGGGLGSASRGAGLDVWPA